MAAQAEKFDPYHKWLGIPPEDQPPSYYRLLALRDFEADVDVIAHAADRAMAHVRTFQNGPRAAWSQRILNELATARVCLLDPRRKEAYDQSLQVKRGIQNLPHRTQAPPRTNVAPPPVAVESPPPQKSSASEGRSVSAMLAQRRARKRIRELISFVVLLCILISLVIAAAIVLRG